MIAIYFLRDPRTGGVRYVGQSEDPEARFRAHLKCDRNTHRDNWVRQLKALGAQPVLQVVEWVLVELANEAESHWIKELRRIGIDLVNATSGGEGTHGYRHTAEAKARMSAARIGNKNALGNDPESYRTRRLGKRMPEEAKRRISASVAAQWQSGARTPTFLGRHHTPEARRRIGEARKAYLEGVRNG